MKKELDILIQTIRIYSQGIRMEFSSEKCVMLIMKKRKSKTTEGIELQNKKAAKYLAKKNMTKNWKFWKWTISNQKRWKKKKNKERLP